MSADDAARVSGAEPPRENERVAQSPTATCAPDGELKRLREALCDIARTYPVDQGEDDKAYWEELAISYRQIAREALARPIGRADKSGGAEPALTEPGVAEAKGRNLSQNAPGSVSAGEADSPEDEAPKDAALAGDAVSTGAPQSESQGVRAQASPGAGEADRARALARWLRKLGDYYRDGEQHELATEAAAALDALVARVDAAEQAANAEAELFNTSQAQVRDLKARVDALTAERNEAQADAKGFKQAGMSFCGSAGLYRERAEHAEARVAELTRERDLALTTSSTYYRRYLETNERAFVAGMRVAELEATLAEIKSWTMHGTAIWTRAHTTLDSRHTASHTPPMQAASDREDMPAAREREDC